MYPPGWGQEEVGKGVLYAPWRCWKTGFGERYSFGSTNNPQAHSSPLPSYLPSLEGPHQHGPIKIKGGSGHHDMMVFLPQLVLSLSVSSGACRGEIPKPGLLLVQFLGVSAQGRVSLLSE